MFAIFCLQEPRGCRPTTPAKFQHRGMRRWRKKGRWESRSPVQTRGSKLRCFVKHRITLHKQPLCDLAHKLYGNCGEAAAWRWTVEVSDTHLRLRLHVQAAFSALLDKLSAICSLFFLESLYHTLTPFSHTHTHTVLSFLPAHTSVPHQRLGEPCTPSPSPPPPPSLPPSLLSASLLSYDRCYVCAAEHKVALLAPRLCPLRLESCEWKALSLTRLGGGLGWGNRAAPVCDGQPRLERRPTRKRPMN